MGVIEIVIGSAVVIGAAIKGSYAGAASNESVDRAIAELQRLDASYDEQIARIWEGGTRGKETAAMIAADTLQALDVARFERLLGLEEREYIGADGRPIDLSDTTKQGVLWKLYQMAKDKLDQDLVDLLEAKDKADARINKEIADLLEIEGLEDEANMAAQNALKTQLDIALEIIDGDITALNENYDANLALGIQHLLDLIEMRDETIEGLQARDAAGDVEATRRIAQINKTAEENYNIVMNRGLLDMNEAGAESVYEVGKQVTQSAQAQGASEAKSAASGVRRSASPLLALQISERENAAAVEAAGRKADYTMNRLAGGTAADLLSIKSTAQANVETIIAENTAFGDEIQREIGRVNTQHGITYREAEASNATLTREYGQRLIALNALRDAKEQMYDIDLAALVAADLLRSTIYGQKKERLEQELLDVEAEYNRLKGRKEKEKEDEATKYDLESKAIDTRAREAAAGLDEAMTIDVAQHGVSQAALLATATGDTATAERRIGYIAEDIGTLEANKQTLATAAFFGASGETLLTQIGTMLSRAKTG